MGVKALLIALAKEDSDCTVRALTAQGVSYDNAADAIASRTSENSYDALLKYGRDLTQAAREGRLDPVIGRRPIGNRDGGWDDVERKEMRSQIVVTVYVVVGVLHRSPSDLHQFKPEFLNRINEYVIFNSLSKDDLRDIVPIEIARLEHRMSERDMTLALTNTAYVHLVDVEFDLMYGSRPLKQTIQQELETAVARCI